MEKKKQQHKRKVLNLYEWLTPPFPKIMGILNITAESFYDGGKYLYKKEALTYAIDMEKNGADIIDIGGESSRPGAEQISVEEELQRVIPVIEEIRKKTDILLSIDTTKAEVARCALRAGVDIINDISALKRDSEMIQV